MTSPMLKYFNYSERTKRTLAVIAFLYILYNGSYVNLVDGVIWAANQIFTYQDNTVKLVLGLVLFAVVMSIATFAYRRWSLAWEQLRSPYLAVFKTLPVAALVVAVCVVISTLVGRNDIDWYITLFEWTWQIPVGFFIGNALSWGVVDRSITGQVTTSEVTTDHSDHAL